MVDRSYSMFSDVVTNVLCGLHLLDSNHGFSDAVRGAQLLHATQVLDLEVDNAFVEALHLGGDHELGHSILEVSCG